MEPLELDRNPEHSGVEDAQCLLEELLSRLVSFADHQCCLIDHGVDACTHYEAPANGVPMSAHCSAYTVPDTGEPSKQLVGIERRAQALWCLHRSVLVNSTGHHDRDRAPTGGTSHLHCFPHLGWACSSKLSKQIP